MVSIMRTSLGLVFSLGLGLPLAAMAQDVRVENAWARSTVEGQQGGGAFVSLTSARALSVVSASSPVAGRVEIHEMLTENGVMKMRRIDKLDLPAGKKVELKPGGHHLMLLDLKRPLKAGEKLPVTLGIAEGNKPVTLLEVSVEVRGAAAASHGTHHKHH